MQVTGERQYSSTERVVWNPLAAASSLWEQRGLVRQLIGREIGGRYRGSYLGVMWALVTPLLMLGIYTVLFGFVFKARWQGRGIDETGVAGYALTLFAGLIGFNLFSEVAGRAPGLVLGVPNYVKRVVFPLEVLVVTAVGTAVVSAVVGMVVLVGASVVMRGHLPWTIVLVPAVWLPLILLSLAVGWVLSSLGTYVRDIGQFIGVALQAYLFMTPVFWPVEAAPGVLRRVLVVNPMTVVVDGMRKVAVFGEQPDWAGLGVWTLVLGLAAWGAHVWFTYSKRGFADVL